MQELSCFSVGTSGSNCNHLLFLAVAGKVFVAVKQKC